MAKEKEETALLIVPKSEMEKKFAVLKAKVDEVAKNCKEIEITDEVSHAIGRNIAIEANELFKTIEEKRKAIKKPYKETGDMIDAVAKTLTGGLNNAIVSARQKIKEYSDTVEKKAKEDLEKLQKEKDENAESASDQIVFLEQIRLEYSQLYKKFKEIVAKTDPKTVQDEVSKLLKSFKKPGEYKHYKADTKDFRDFISVTGENKVSFLEGSEVADKEHFDKNSIAFLKFKNYLIEKINDEIEDISNRNKGENIEVISKIVEASSVKIDGNRKVWKFEVEDASKVPVDYLTVDTDKIKELMKNTKDKSTLAIPGIKFFQDTTVTLV